MRIVAVFERPSTMAVSFTSNGVAESGTPISSVIEPKAASCLTGSSTVFPAASARSVTSEAGAGQCHAHVHGPPHLAIAAKEKGRRPGRNALHVGRRQLALRIAGQA